MSVTVKGIRSHLSIVSSVGHCHGALQCTATKSSPAESACEQRRERRVCPRQVPAHPVHSSSEEEI